MGLVIHLNLLIYIDNGTFEEIFKQFNSCLIIFIRMIRLFHRIRPV